MNNTFHLYLIRMNKNNFTQRKAQRARRMFRLHIILMPVMLVLTYILIAFGVSCIRQPDITFTERLNNLDTICNYDLIPSF